MTSEWSSTDVAAFEQGPDVDPAAVGDAYREKYGRSSYVDAMVAAAAAGTTMRRVPR